MWVKLEGDNNLKVTWASQDGIFDDSYTIGMKSLLAAAAKVREELVKLSDWAVGRNPETRWERLTDLATAGNALHKELFSDLSDRDRIKAIQRLINDDYADGQRGLTINADPSLHVPWGLVFDGKVPTEPGTPDPGKLEQMEMSLFSNFWALKYDLSIGSKLKAPGAIDSQQERFGLLSLVNGEVFQSIGAQVGDPSCSALCELMRQKVGTARSLAECEELIAKTDASDILFHFFGHQHDQSLILGPNPKDTVSIPDFGTLLETLIDRSREFKSSPYGLLFLNGCDSATGNSDYSFKSKALVAEKFGVIATEAKVRTNFAAKFSHRFLKALVNDGQTVSAAMHDLWHAEDMWPESLLYGCYANPRFRIRPGAGTAAGAR